MIAAGVAIAIFHPSPTALAEDEPLPANVQSVIQKMQAFEAKTLMEAQIKIEGKRREVIRFLEARLEIETRDGNLDGGLAIRAEIDRLKAAAIPTKPAPSALAGSPRSGDGTKEGAGEDEETEKPDEEDGHPIVGRWKFQDPSGAELVREFTSGGKCIQYRSGRREFSLDYEIVNSREVDVVFLGALKFRHTVRGNGTLKTMQPEAVARREEASTAGTVSNR